MKVAKWDADTQALYWKQKTAEEDLIETQELARQEEFDRGKLKGEIKGEISKVKSLIKFKIKPEEIFKTLKFLVGDNEAATLKNITYIQQHINEEDSDIGENLGLLGDSQGL